MQRPMLFKKFLMPCGLCAAVPVLKVNPPEEPAKPCCSDADSPKMIKPSELPIYSLDDGYTTQMPCVKETPSLVEENIRKVRLQLRGVKDILDELSHYVSRSVDNFKFVIDYIQDDANLVPRAGAVGIGGLSGLILGLRGGLFKKLLYSTTGAGIIGSICFPKEAKQVYNEVEHYALVSYNFAYGVKPGDPKGENSFKELPLIKNVIESEYFKLLTRPFESSVAEKKEETPTSNKEEIKEK